MGYKTVNFPQFSQITIFVHTPHFVHVDCQCLNFSCSLCISIFLLVLVGSFFIQKFLSISLSISHAFLGVFFSLHFFSGSLLMFHLLSLLASRNLSFSSCHLLASLFFFVLASSDLGLSHLSSRTMTISSVELCPAMGLDYQRRSLLV